MKRILTSKNNDMKKTIDELASEYIQELAGTNPNADLSAFSDDYRAFVAGANAVKKCLIADVGETLHPDLNRRQIINKILHEHIDVNKYEDYTNYKKLITAIEEWHESEVKKLPIPDVVGQSEQLCDHPRSERSYIGRNMLRCNKCGKEFS
ncbi:hypothetical protein OAA15_00600 [bacterium]|nr:hypothetical protein [bacterium]